MVRQNTTGIPSPKIIGKKEYARRHSQIRRVKKHDHILKLQREWRKKNRKKIRDYHRNYYHNKLRDKYMENKLDGIIEAVHEKKLPPELLDVVIDFLDYLTWQNVREIRKLKERIKKHQINQNNGIIQKLNGKIKNMRSK